MESGQPFPIRAARERRTDHASSVTSNVGGIMSLERMVHLRRIAVAALAAVLIPMATSAQQASGISGLVRDASGGVLPGVTVEAASPALIEKVRAATTDGE